MRQTSESLVRRGRGSRGRGDRAQCSAASTASRSSCSGGRPVVLAEHPFDRRDDVQEADPPGEERLDALLVGRVVDGGVRGRRRDGLRAPGGPRRTPARRAARTSRPSACVQSHGGVTSATRSGQDSPRAIGSRMSGGDACASVEPSTNSTIECTTDCGCTTTVMSSTGTSNSRCASMSSRPLFMRVEELMVTTGPIDQVGCASACWGVTVLTSSCGPAPERAARRGEDEATDLGVRAAAQSLRDGRVLGVDRHDLVRALPRGVHERAADHQRLLVGQRERAAGPQRRERRSQTDRPGDAVEHDVGAAAGQLAWPPADRRGSRPRGSDSRRRASARGSATATTCDAQRASLPGQQVDVTAARAEPDDGEPVGVAADDVDGLGADRSGGAEEDDGALRSRGHLRASDADDGHSTPSSTSTARARNASTGPSA